MLRRLQRRNEQSLECTGGNHRFHFAHFLSVQTQFAPVSQTGGIRARRPGPAAAIAAWRRIASLYSPRHLSTRAASAPTPAACTPASPGPPRWRQGTIGRYAPLSARSRAEQQAEPSPAGTRDPRRSEPEQGGRTTPCIRWPQRLPPQGPRQRHADATPRFRRRAAGPRQGPRCLPAPLATCFRRPVPAQGYLLAHLGAGPSTGPGGAAAEPLQSGPWRWVLFRSSPAERIQAGRAVVARSQTAANAPRDARDAALPQQRR